MEQTLFFPLCTFYGKAPLYRCRLFHPHPGSLIDLQLPFPKPIQLQSSCSVSLDPSCFDSIAVKRPLFTPLSEPTLGLDIPFRFTPPPPTQRPFRSRGNRTPPLSPQPFARSQALFFFIISLAGWRCCRKTLCPPPFRSRSSSSRDPAAYTGPRPCTPRPPLFPNFFLAPKARLSPSGSFSLLLFNYV